MSLGSNDREGENAIEPLNDRSNGVNEGTQTNSISNSMPAQKTISRERTLFLILCCITITFFICHSPRYISYIFTFFYRLDNFRKRRKNIYGRKQSFEKPKHECN